MYQEISSIKNKIITWIKKNKVNDVLIFGSMVRGKSVPSDIDLCIILSDTMEDKSIDCVDSLHKLIDKDGKKFQITCITSSNLIKGNSLAKTLLLEGFSIKNNESFSATFGLRNCSFVNYSLKKFTPSQRVRFHYVLNGRYGMKGVLKEVGGTIARPGLISMDTINEDKLREIFDKWKVSYTISRNLIG